MDIHIICNVMYKSNSRGFGKTTSRVRAEVKKSEERNSVCICGLNLDVAKSPKC